MSLAFDVFTVDPRPIPSAVPGFEDAVAPATWPPSTSTLISDGADALLVDCLIREQDARDLAAWVKSHGCAPGYVYITHPHADHFLGLPEILAVFPDAKPVALAESIPAAQEQIADFEAALARSSAPGELIDWMTAAYSDFANPYTLWVAAYDLLGAKA
jgi:glyoxylase-like metal-dependent hydrolase (beta-lactamase superfamily II)